MKKIGLLLASMVFVFAVNAQTPEKKECCKDKAKTECCSKNDMNAKQCDKSKDASCCASKDKDAKKACESKAAEAGSCCKGKVKATPTDAKKSK